MSRFASAKARPEVYRLPNERRNYPLAPPRRARRSLAAMLKCQSHVASPHPAGDAAGPDGRERREGPPMTPIKQEDFIRSVADALQYISYYHPADYIESLAAAYEAEESPAAKDAIAQILTNSRMCAEGHRPICQDTGIVVAFVNVGMDVRWEGATMSPTDMINEGVRRAYLDPDNKLRASI